MVRVTAQNGALLFEDIGIFSLAKSCACGQSFRWKPQEDGGFLGVVGNKQIYAHQSGSTLRLEPCAPEDAAFWVNYFDLERDYEAINNLLHSDERLRVCAPCASGIHLFRQDPYETLISFILSANNNIKRISGIIERLCTRAGEDMGGYYAFPTPNAVSALSEQALIEIGAGYRAPYVQKSAMLVAQGYDLEALRHMPLAKARKELQAFPGVGPKVADCILLFSLGHMDAFPVDVWIGRAMRELFFCGEQPPKVLLDQLIARLGPYSGIIQQYIFQYARENALGRKKTDKK